MCSLEETVDYSLVQLFMLQSQCDESVGISSGSTDTVVS